MKKLILIILAVCVQSTAAQALTVLNVASQSYRQNAPLLVGVSEFTAAPVPYAQASQIDATVGDIVSAYSLGGDILASTTVEAGTVSLVFHAPKDSPLEVMSVIEWEGCDQPGARCYDLVHLAPIDDDLVWNFTCRRQGGTTVQISGSPLKYNRISGGGPSTSNDLSPRRCGTHGVSNLARSVFWPDVELEVETTTTLTMLFIGDGEQVPAQVVALADGQLRNDLELLKLDLDNILPTNELAFENPDRPGSGLVVERTNAGNGLFIVEYFHDEEGKPRWRCFQLAKDADGVYTGKEYAPTFQNNAVALTELGSAQAFEDGTGMRIERMGDRSDSRYFTSSLDR